MSHTVVGALTRAAVIALIVGFAPQSVEGAGRKEPSGAAIVVRTYTAPESEAAMPAARLTGGAILGRAGVEVAWLECGLTANADAAAACSRPLQAHELVVRILPAGGKRSGPHLEMLGFAFVDAATGGGSLATVYPDRVDRVAQSAGIDAAELLGRAIAHEIGHLLLGTSRHSLHGLMRAAWTDQDLRRRVTNEWLFDRQQAEVLRRAIASRMRSYN
jgi:hypothetical protein